jgi:uncharacterized membrane protein
MINPSEHKPDRMKKAEAAAPTQADPETQRRLDWVKKVRLMHRNKRMLGFAGIILGAGMVSWARLSPSEAPPWALYTGFSILAVSWAVFIYVLIDRGRWVRNNPYKPGG